MSSFTKTLIVDSDPNSTPDYYTIKEAAAYLNSLDAGGTIIVEQGTYNLDDIGNQKTIPVPSNVTIIGRGNAIIKVQANISAFTAIGKERISISGFKIQVDVGSGNSYSANLINFTAVQDSFLGQLTINVASGTISSTSSAINISGVTTPISYSKGNIITGCNITNFCAGINLTTNCQENIISGNVISGCTNNISIADSSNNNITNNMVSSSTGTGTNDAGLFVTESDYTIIQGNIVKSNGNFGINLNQSGYCTIQGNVCDSNTSYGINLKGASSSNKLQYNSLVGNNCKSNGGAGVSIGSYAVYNSVDGNNCISNGAYGIVESASGADHNLLVGNTCMSNTTGVYRNGTSTVLANNFTI